MIFSGKLKYNKIKFVVLEMLLVKPIRRSWAEVNLDYARQNWEILKQHTGNLPFCPVVKADAYGHGAAMLAPLYRHLGAEYFAVSCVDEALELLSSGIRNVLVLGYTPPHAVGLVSRHSLAQTVCDFNYAKELSTNAATMSDRQVLVHIKLDTGMGRLGFDCRTMERAKQSVAKILEVCTLPHLVPAGIFTHFATADEPEGAFLQEQYQRFCYVVEQIKQVYPNMIVHCSNSAATVYSPQIKSDMYRIGILLYGLSPNPALALPTGLKPIMCFKTVVAMVKTVLPGDYISYGCTYQAQTPRKIATLPVGYGDGYRRELSNKGCVLIGGQKAPVVGRVCMDQTMVDVTDIDVQPGDEVILFGDPEGILTADDVADICNTIGYEIVCGISKRVPRLYIQDGELL